MIEKILSVQDTIAIALLLGIIVKLIQFFYFDKKNKQGGKRKHGINNKINKHSR